ncbi:MAG: VacJ family lipoprotein [Desulfobacteraceae bacterium]|nr:VacJ family lipoprotein [Desulfobacteraceae bacterium]
MRRFAFLTLLLQLLLAPAVPALAQDEFADDLFDDYVDAGEVNPVPDPFYKVNHAVYTFNDRLYFWVMKPVARTYGSVVPGDLRTGVHNMFVNLLFPVRFVNLVCQGKIGNAGTELAVFAVNSTSGVLGFGRPAQQAFGLEIHKEDLGQTLGSYSIKEGCYLVLPFLGPSTLRDLVGIVGDSFLSPINYVTPRTAFAGLRAFDAVNKTSLLRVGDYETLKQAAVDPYVAIKDGYIQLRRKRIQD